MRLKLTIIAAMAAFSVLAADLPKPAPKAADPAPQIATAKFWRLVAAAQQARNQANQTPQAKAADAADLEVQREQEALSQKCGANHILGYQQDAKAENAGDIICVLKPPPAAEAKPEPKKEK